MLQGEARPEALGKQVAGKLCAPIELRSVTRRTPCGPSETSMAGMPSLSAGVVVHALAPVQSAAFSSSVICPIRALMSAMVMLLGHFMGLFDCMLENVNSSNELLDGPATVYHQCFACDERSSRGC